jgi:hypothetical protein
MCMTLALASMAMWEPVCLEILFEDDEHEDADDGAGGEPTCVGRLSREEIAAMLREADAHEGRAPRVAESGIRAVDTPRAWPAAPPVVVPPAPRLPAGADLDDAEPTVVASVLPLRPVSDTADDEIARVLDFDWEAHAPSESALAQPSAPMPMPMPIPTAAAGSTPSARRVALVGVLLAFAAAAVVAFALIVPILVCLLAWR